MCELQNRNELATYVKIWNECFLFASSSKPILSVSFQLV